MIASPFPWGVASQLARSLAARVSGLVVKNSASGVPCASDVDTRGQGAVARRELRAHSRTVPAFASSLVLPASGFASAEGRTVAARPSALVLTATRRGSDARPCLPGSRTAQPEQTATAVPNPTRVGPLRASGLLGLERDNGGPCSRTAAI